MRSSVSRLGMWVAGVAVIATSAALAVAASSPAGASSGGPLVDGGVYTIGLVGTSEVIGDPDYSDDASTQLNIRANHSGTNQHWRVTADADGSYLLRNIASDMCMDDAYSSSDSGNPIIQWYCTGNPNQRWNLVATGGGFALVNVASGLSVTPDGSDDGSWLVQRYHNPGIWGFRRYDSPSSSTPPPPKPANTVSVANPGDQSGIVGSPTSLQVHATDSDSAQTLTYTASGLPTGLSINGASGQISGTPTSAGTSTVKVTASDTTNVYGTASFSWTVNPAPAPAPAPAPSSTALHPVTIVVTTPSGATADETTTENQVRHDFANVSTYWKTESNGLVDFELASLDWWPGHGTCGGSQDGPTVTAAEKAWGFKPGPQKHFIVMVDGCADIYGIGEQPNTLLTVGGYVYLEGISSADTMGGWTHELGHNLGFGHASTLVCPGTADDGDVTSAGGKCTTHEYQDWYDTMGFSPNHSYKGFSAPNAIAAGFLPSSAYVNITGTSNVNQTVTINTRDRFSGVRAVQITDPRSGTKYWVELSSMDGYDVDPDNYRHDFTADGIKYQADYGVRVLKADQSNGGTLLLAAPPVNGVRDLYWPAGTAFTSASGGITVTVLSTTSTTATVRIQTAS